jgi:hypothetical protein
MLKAAAPDQKKTDTPFGLANAPCKLRIGNPPFDGLFLATSGRMMFKSAPRRGATPLEM